VSILSLLFFYSVLNLTILFNGSPKPEVRRSVKMGFKVLNRTVIFPRNSNEIV